MRVGLYARVSTEAQEARGTIGSQLAALRERVAAAGDELVAEYIDDGYSGARLDRPGLDALRDAAEAGLLDAVWCLSPDRLARLYAYQVIVLDELARHGVRVRFADAPPLDDDPQARLLTQVQGVIAEYERAKIAERYRRGKLWRARAGEVTTWKVSYGYRRVARQGTQPAHLELYEPEAAIVRRIFEDYVAGGHSMRTITRRLNAAGIPSPTGKAVWGTSTIGRLLRNEAYVGRVYYNRTEVGLDRQPGHRARQVRRPREQWIPIAVPRLLADELFEAAQRVSRDNSQWSPRRAEPGRWLLRQLLKCGTCGVGMNCHRMRGRNGTFHVYYYCRNHDPLRAGGEQRRCPERNIRADALDAFVVNEVRTVLTRPELLLTGERAVAVRAPAPDDELLAAQLARLDRKADAAAAERSRLVDLYQAGLLALVELQRRAKEIESRCAALAAERQTLIGQREALAKNNRLRQRIHDFAQRVLGVLDGLSFPQWQQLLRLVVEAVRVSGWHVEIQLRIPLDSPPDPPAARPNGRPRCPNDGGHVSSDDRLRSLGSHGGRELQKTTAPRRAHRPATAPPQHLTTQQKETPVNQNRGYLRVGPIAENASAGLYARSFSPPRARLPTSTFGEVTRTGGLPRPGEQLPTVWTGLLHRPNALRAVQPSATAPPTMWTAASALVHWCSYALCRTISTSGRRKDQTLNQGLEVVL
jgi:site-specific DNA recombinase